MDEDAVETPKQDTSEGNGVDDKLSTPIVTLPTGLGPSREGCIGFLVGGLAKIIRERMVKSMFHKWS